MKLIQTTIAVITLFSLAASAEIREIKKMAEILPHIDQNTAVVFDLDNTVMEPLQAIGSDQFFGWLKKSAEDNGMPTTRSLKWAIDAVTPIAPVVPTRAVEAITPRLIKSLQDRGVPVFALTARPPHWAGGTIKQVSNLGIDFSLSGTFARQNQIGPQGLFTRGILFVALGYEKGPVLLNFLKATRLKINNLVFVDDKISNVTSVESSFKGLQLKNTNFRYGAADPTVKAFNPLIAGTQWQCFKKSGKVLSDELARLILLGRTSCETAQATGF